MTFTAAEKLVKSISLKNELQLKQNILLTVCQF